MAKTAKEMSSGTGNGALLIVISAPSGAGKTTLCDRLLEDRADMVYSISCTTREPRGDEEDGEDYFFLTEQEFERRAKAGMFLEWATVHGHRYGTLKETVLEGLAAGEHVLMDIDVQGAASIRDYARRAPSGDPIREGWVDIFVEPPSLEALEARLVGRGENTGEDIRRRLEAAAEEMKAAGAFRYRIVNDDLAMAYRRLKEMVEIEADKRRM